VRSKVRSLLMCTVFLGSPFVPFLHFASAQQTESSAGQSVGSVGGIVLDAQGAPVAGAIVRLESTSLPAILETQTDAAGKFVFAGVPTRSYQLLAEKSGRRSRAATITVAANVVETQVSLLLEPPATPAMEFADKPNFTVAGVTDWTAVGGHGSDSSLRTSEDLARETQALSAASAAPPAKPSVHQAEFNPEHDQETKLRTALERTPQSVELNEQLGRLYLNGNHYKEAIPPLLTAYRGDVTNSDNEYELAQAYSGAGDFADARDHVQELLLRKDSADLHRLAGDLDEKLGDPLAAVQQDEQAVRMDPSEQNYFAWGSELLLHRAIRQAREVFGNGSKAYPKSARMLAALGAALFASAAYDEAAQTLCASSDLNPADPQPYLFLGKIEIAAPAPLPCAEEKLARFAREQPSNAYANYLYAMALWKRQEVVGQAKNTETTAHAEKLLTNAVAADHACYEAYLQLGIIYADGHDYTKAIGFYEKALAIDPKLSEAHYRLGVAYDRAGERDKAKIEFQLHAELEKEQAAAVEKQRSEVKQFVVALPDKPSNHP
jgi:tetratricopeptide (TPR) repeat protein